MAEGPERIVVVDSGPFKQEKAKGGSNRSSDEQVNGSFRKFNTSRPVDQIVNRYQRPAHGVCCPVNMTQNGNAK